MMETTETTETTALYDARLKRFEDAIALKEPDRVPCIPEYTVFPYLWAGYTMKEVMYDLGKAQDAITRYNAHFQPDISYGYGDAFAGMGPIFDILKPKWLLWAGMQGRDIPDDSMQQFIEREWMEDDEYEQLNGDMGGWVQRVFLPRTMDGLAGLSSLDFRMATGNGFMGLVGQFLDPDLRTAIKNLEDAADAMGAWGEQNYVDDQATEASGFPMPLAAAILNPYDSISDYLRGTMGTSFDVMECADDMKTAIDRLIPLTLESAIAQASMAERTLVSIPMHKGMDGFLNNDLYREFYWNPLLEIINGLVAAGLTPWLYTEGPYNSRLEFLQELPKGKCWVHFETVDVVRAKEMLGDIACISGGISCQTLRIGTVQETIDVVKRNMDVLAPGGGFIFDLADTIDGAKPENAEALFETVREYGVY